jgi:hypothetical protein
MLHPTIINKNATIRYNEMLQSAEQYRQAKKLSHGRTFNWPNLSNWFTVRKPEKKTAVATQAR